MVVMCPKCKTRLKVDETKLSPEGSRFKCPKCSTVLVVKKPAPHVKKDLDGKKVLVAHSNPQVLDKAVSILSGHGYEVIKAADGIDCMVRALKECPFLAILEVALPKIYGFEVCKRLKTREETKDIKFILIPAIHDKAKYRRDPVSLYGADEYIEEHDLDAQLIEKINRIVAPKEEEKQEKPSQIVVKVPEPKLPKEEQEVKAPTPPPPADATSDEKIEKARRLARTIVHDIYLYNSAKVDESIKNDNFYSVFASEIKEGQKLYDNRIPQEIRNIKDFFREASDNFIASKRKT